MATPFMGLVGKSISFVKVNAVINAYRTSLGCVEGTEWRTVFCSVIVRVLPFLYGDCESESMFNVVVLNRKLNMGLLKY